MADLSEKSPQVDRSAAVAVVAAKLLAAKGERDLAALVERSSMTQAPGTESWTVGSRMVDACRLALIVSPEDFVRLRVREGDLDEIRWAVASAVRSGTTELAELLVVVRLPFVDAPWSTAYRSSRPAADDTTPEGVIEAAAGLAEAYGHRRAAALLRRSALDMVDIPEEWIAQRRIVLQVVPADLVASERDPDLAEMLRRCVTHAATRASARVLSFEIRLRPPE
jgi:hypothetical protein